MRNLKKMLSLVMALAMIASFMVVGASAAFTDEKDIKNTDAINTLVSLGIIKGRDTGAFDPTGIVTRAEMAKMICVAYNGGNDPVLGTTTATSYTDTVGHWASGYIEYCTNLKIVSGFNGKFNPDATVSGAEAAKMLLVTLGYDPTVFGFTGVNWQVNTDVQANSAKLYDDLKGLNSSAGLSRDNAGQMIYNALNAYVMEKTYDKILSNGEISYSYKLSADKTLLTEKFGVTKVEAVIVGNEHATLTGSSDAAKDAGKTQIVLTDPTDGDGYPGTYKVTTSLDMLGQSVTMFIKYKNNSDKDAVVFGTPVLSGSNAIITDTDGTKLATVGTTKGLLAKNDLTVNSTTKVVKNYADVTPVTVNATNIDGALAQVAGGTITLIDNDDNDVVDYVIYVEYTAGAVTAYSTKDDGSIKIAGIDRNDKANEKVVGFENVAKGDYVLAIEFGGKVYVEKPEAVTGKLEAYSTSKETLKVDGTTYDFSGITSSVSSTTKEMKNVASYVSNAALSNTATFYLDKSGKVIAVSDADETYGQYAVILAKQTFAAGNGSSLGTESKVKLLLSDGTAATYPVYSIGGVKPETGFDSAVAQYDIYTYALTEDGKVKLGTEKDASASQTTTFNSGKSTVTAGSDSATVTSNTVFLYWNADKVTRFVGKGAPDISGTKTSAMVKNDSDEALVVFVQAAAANQYDGNYVYVYKTKVGENSDGYEVSAILKDGTITTITVDAATRITTPGSAGTSNALNTSAMTIVPGMYNYSKDGEVYTLSQVDSLNNTTGATTPDNYMDYETSGVVAGVASDYVKVGSKSYAMTADTVVNYGKTNKDAQADEVVTKGDTVTVVYNDDDEAVLVIVIEYAPDTYTVTYTSGNNVSNKLTAGSDIVSGTNVAANTTVTVVADGANYCKVVSGGNTNYYANGGTFTLTADATVTFAPKVAITAGTFSGSNSVTATMTVDKATAVPGETVTVTVTLGGTPAANSTITGSGVIVTGYAGTPTGATVTASGVTTTASTVVSGTFTYTFVATEAAATPTVTEV